MKRILLVSNHVFHYRRKIYNYFFDAFVNKGYEFHVMSNSFQEVNFPVKYIEHNVELKWKSIMPAVDEINPDIIITFLHLKDAVIFPLTLYYAGIKRIPVIYWNHGVNLEDPNNKLKNMVFKFVHSISSAIILYTPNEIKYISRRNRKKISIGYNTLYFDEYATMNEIDIRKEYKITEKHIILFCGRITKRKGLDILLRIADGISDTAVVIVGPGITDEQKKKISENDSYYYLGEIYEDDLIGSIFKEADIYSTPGHLGLGINQALFWGTPVFALKGNHAPEVYYLKQGENGFLANDEEELKHELVSVLSDSHKLVSMKEEALKTMRTEGAIDSMFDGFYKAVEYVKS